MSFESLLNRRCSIYRCSPRNVDSNYTLDSLDYTLVKSDVPCCIQEKPTGASARISTTGGTVQQISAVMYFESDIDVRPSSGDSSGDADRVIADDGSKYEVVSVVDQTGLGKFKRVEVRSWT